MIGVANQSGRARRVVLLPETLNAFTGLMHTSMSRIWDDVNDNPNVHVMRRID
jgi:hypothetical protein